MSNKEEFTRILNNKDVLSLSFGAMIGWGWVVLSQVWIREAGSLGAILAFLAGGLIVTLVGLTYAELTSAMPKVGGEHVFGYRGLGVSGSFISTWAIILGYVSVSAFEAVALPTVISLLVPNFEVGLLWTVAGWDVYASWVLVGIGGSLIVCVVNYFGVKPVAFLQWILILFILTAGLFLMLGGMFSPHANLENMKPLFVNNWGGFFAVLVMTPFMFVGFDVIPQAAEEINLPFKQIGKVLIFSVVLSVFWYILIIFGVSNAMNADQLSTTTMATADSMRLLYNTDMASTFLVLAGIAGILTSWNGFYLGASRAIYAMAHSNMLPKYFAYLHPKYKTPTRAVLLIGFLTALAPLFGRKAMVWLVNAGGLTIIVSWTLVSLSFLVLRYKEPNMERPFKVSFGKLVGFLAVILSIGMGFLYLPGNPSALSWPEEWIIIALWFSFGAGMYVFCLKRYGRESIVEVMEHQIKSS
jgi:amino acid transporter